MTQDITLRVPARCWSVSGPNTVTLNLPIATLIEVLKHPGVLMIDHGFVSGHPWLTMRIKRRPDDRVDVEVELESGARLRRGSELLVEVVTFGRGLVNR